MHYELFFELYTNKFYWNFTINNGQSYDKISEVYYLYELIKKTNWNIGRFDLESAKGRWADVKDVWVYISEALWRSCIYFVAPLL